MHCFDHVSYIIFIFKHMVIKSAGNVLFIVLISVRVACSASTHVRAVAHRNAKITKNSDVQRVSDLLVLQPKALFEN